MDITITSSMLAIIIIILIVFFRTMSGYDRFESEAQIKKKTPFIEVVTSDADRERGLSGRSVIPTNYGMLFVAPVKQQMGMWMKDMLQPIDIIWIDDEGQLIKVLQNVPVNSYPKLFYPDRQVRFVLETKAGEGLKIVPYAIEITKNINNNP